MLKTLHKVSATLGAWLVVVVMLLAAPVQCPAHREPRRERVTPPAEAVYRSATNLRRLGHSQAYEATLRHIVTRYPGTQAAARASDDLEALGEPPQ